MHYYNITLLNSPLEPFTYHSSKIVNIGTKVKVKVKNRECLGVVISDYKEPDFKTNEILEVYDAIYSEKQLSLSRFISAYYFCSLGEALGLMLPFSSSQVLLGDSDISMHSQAEHGNEVCIKLSSNQKEALF
ncbi:hypothetical protein [Sulfurimonas sp. RIFCSPLOWO2_12_36_12]|uniref:primosomal protein N' family DNA-binding protein n=1 Tax=Sulfurimonas sp. RIFCSPLOWO2_12_36_12 TaxID=1802253 RepID=UPI0025D1EC69|nr:hypothetical protein [Sulfurimonas sp. RIFCSPLOWO2_12_36_12]